jgi:AcrR family transcriptional regulator
VADATVAVILRGTYYWVLGLFAIPRPRFTRALAATIHRVVHGPLAGVNVDPLVQLSALPAPRWPDAPTDLPLDRTLRSRGVATRQKLLDAAGAVLPRRGFHNTRVDDIAEEAGVSHGSFYRYFASTDDVFRVLALEASAPMAELVDSFPATVGSTPSPALREWLVRWFDVYRSNGGVISAWEEIDFDKPDVAAMSIEVMLVFFDRLVRLVDARGFGDGAVDAIALLAVVERLPYAVVVQRTLDESPAIAAAQHLIERGILGRPS